MSHSRLSSRSCPGCVVQSPTVTVSSAFGLVDQLGTSERSYPLATGMAVGGADCGSKTSWPPVRLIIGIVAAVVFVRTMLEPKVNLPPFRLSVALELAELERSVLMPLIDSGNRRLAEKHLPFANFERRLALTTNSGGPGDRESRARVHHVLLNEPGVIAVDEDIGIQRRIQRRCISRFDVSRGESERNASWTTDRILHRH